MGCEGGFLPIKGQCFSFPFGSTALHCSIGCLPCICPFVTWLPPIHRLQRGSATVQPLVDLIPTLATLFVSTSLSQCQCMHAAIGIEIVYSVSALPQRRGGGALNIYSCHTSTDWVQGRQLRGRQLCYQTPCYLVNRENYPRWKCCPHRPLGLLTIF